VRQGDDQPKETIMSEEPIFDPTVQTLDVLAKALSDETGREVMDIRLNSIRRWALKLYAVEKSEAGAIGTLLDICALAPGHYPGWSLLSAIDAMVDTYVAHAEVKPAADNVVEFPR
jgi:hypothetical protein